ncbi:alpha-L-fucosidase [Paraflavisolibacter sp. H34]|uniref:alpha-L-fucosidase n=1 Tax=Huijunlia imazamoxiresistens TaxID=3127457 RepID=UPI00301B2AC6
MKKRNIPAVPLLAGLSLCMLSSGAFAQKEADRVKMEHAQIGIVEDKTSGYTHTTHPDARWFPQAGLGMFLHWGISTLKEKDLSWPMMAGTQIGWRAANNRLDSAEVRKIMESGDYFAGHACQKDNSCITPNEYWALAKDFQPKSYDPEKWVKAAKEAGMTYVVFTTRHHDGFALWPSAYGNFNTKNYMGGRDLVKNYVAACRKYGLKVGLYYSGPDWYFNRDFQSFMYYGVSRSYPNIPSLDANLQPRKTEKTEAEKQAHYHKVAAYIKGQVEELLTNYGRIDMIWFDGAPDIPKGHPAWKECISMDRIRQLQPGIIVSPRFFGYGDYKTFESDKNAPTTLQDGWAEFCTTSTQSGWAYTPAPMKSSAHLLNYLVKCRSLNTNMLLNFGPTKEGELTPEMYDRLNDIAGWMKVNGAAIRGARALEAPETASVPATAANHHRYLFVLPKQGTPAGEETVVFQTPEAIQAVRLLGRREKLFYTVQCGTLTVRVPAAVRTPLGEVIDVTLK